MNSPLLLCEELIAGCCDQRKKHLNALCAQKFGLWILNVMAGQINSRTERLICHTYFRIAECLHSKYLSLLIKVIFVVIITTITTQILYCTKHLIVSLIHFSIISVATQFIFFSLNYHFYRLSSSSSSSSLFSSSSSLTQLGKSLRL
jgi:hypothetical protein